MPEIITAEAANFEELAQDHGFWVPTGGETEDGIHYSMMVEVKPSDSDFEEILARVRKGFVEGVIRI